MKYTRIIIPVLLLVIVPIVAFASHIAGGGFEYKYLGDSNTAGGRYRIYEVTLYLYQDCVQGDIYAMSADNPAFFTVYINDGQLFKVDTNIYYENSGSIDIPSGLETKCGTFYDLSVLCMQRKKFVKRYALPDNDDGYTIAYQRCCRTTIAQNIISAGEQGLTYYCELPNKNVRNSSAQFKEYPPLAICLNKQATFDHSATDADGDSLSYELDVAYNGAMEDDIKPKICTPPPYNAVPYALGYSAETPMGADAELQIDDATGILSVNPKKVGGYQVAILCHEWRNGVRVNTTRREFLWMVMNCEKIENSYRPNAGIDRIVLVGDTIQFNVTNAVSQHWEPAKFLDDATSATPVGKFTEPGIITYIVHGTSATGCKGDDTVSVHVVEHTKYQVPNAFTPNGDGLNDQLLPIAVGELTFRNMRIFNRWGVELFYTKNTTTGWDGTYNNTPQDAGTYVWQIEYTDSVGKPRVASGSVILLR